MVTPERYEEIHRAFDHSRSLAEADREAWLRERCAKDEALLDMVRLLLRKSDERPSLLDRSALSIDLLAGVAGDRSAIP
jgi:hypothetical protein